MTRQRAELEPDGISFHTVHEPRSTAHAVQYALHVYDRTDGQFINGSEFLRELVTVGKNDDCSWYIFVIVYCIDTYIGIFEMFIFVVVIIIHGCWDTNHLKVENVIRHTLLYLPLIRW